MSDHDHAAKPKSTDIDSATRAPSAPATSGASAADVLDRRARDSVHTVWWLDYHAVAGRQKGTPDRRKSDQLVVDSLKIRQPGERQSTILRGGNLADSGDTRLGEVIVKKGPGTVSAACHYSTKSGFDLKLTLDKKQPGDEKALAGAHKYAMQRIDAMREDRGDYAAMASEIQGELAERFPGRVLTVTAVPDKGKAGDGLAAVEAEYAAEADSEFVVVVDPAVTKDRTDSKTVGGALEEGSADSDQAGATTSGDVQMDQRIKEAQKSVSSFTERLTEGAQESFKTVEESLLSATNSKGSKTEGKLIEKGGIGPAKDNDASKNSGGTPSSGGNGGWFHKLVSKAGHWVWSKAKSLPIVGTGLELVGDLWDQIKVRGWAEVEHSGADSTDSSQTNTASKKAAHEIASLSTLSDEVTSMMSAEVSSEVEQHVATRFGLQLSQVHKRDTSKKKNSSYSLTTNRAEAEMSKPTITIRKRG